MNIKGGKYANEARIIANQRNNATEKMNLALLHELKAELKGKPTNQWMGIIDSWIAWGWLELCSAETIGIILEALGIIKKDQLPEFLGLKAQTGDFLAIHINNPLYDKEYSSGLTFDNRNMYNWIKVLKKIGLKTKVIDDPKFTEIRAEYMKGRCAMLHRKGHYMAGVGHDLDTGKNVHIDPNGGKRVFQTVQDWQDTKYLHALVIWIDE